MGRRPAPVALRRRGGQTDEREASWKGASRNRPDAARHCKCKGSIAVESAERGRSLSESESTEGNKAKRSDGRVGQRDSELGGYNIVVVRGDR